MLAPSAKTPSPTLRGATFRASQGNHGVHTGAQYHELIQASRRARRTRARFQELALELLPARADVLDFGAGTGIDAKAYSARGHRTFVYEPSASMRAHLGRHCREEIANGNVVMVASPAARKVKAVTANFAVLNHFADHAPVFEGFARVVEPDGFVLASMLSPWYVADLRRRWWWTNLPRLLRNGQYPGNGESGVHRFAPRAVARAAAPHFRLERVIPQGPGLTAGLYMFLLLRRT